MTDSHGRSRRRFIRNAATLAGAAWTATVVPGIAADQDAITLPFENGERQLVAFPQKRPLIVLTSRPPQLETPFSVFDEGLLTPNDAFFVRYHWSAIPSSVDLTTYQVRVSGLVAKPLELTLDGVKQLGDAIDLVAVNQCSGNGRGHFVPRVNGGQLSNGAMGNARWTGIPLARVLKEAGIKAGAVQVTFNGLDRQLGDGPDFVKALDIDHALDGDVMLAWQMNGADLPLLNGYPLRLVVPGYYGTYWVKHLTDITVVDRNFDGFWMSSAYRIPANTCACVDPGTSPAKTIPINRFNVRSFITNPANDQRVMVGREAVVRGIAFDSGYGITEVALSTDGGMTWQATTLDEDPGRYAFRRWMTTVTPKRKGPLDLKVRAVNRIGQTQPLTALWNPAGYMRNVVEAVRVEAV